MSVKINKTMPALILCLSLTFAGTQVLAQEGVLHRLVRAAVAVPEAVLRSLHGSPCPCESGCDSCCRGSTKVHYPYISQVNYGQSYGHVSPLDVLSMQVPSYVTYDVVLPGPCRQNQQADVYVYSPIPFNNR